jgi:hypothetical protein
MEVVVRHSSSNPEFDGACRLLRADRQADDEGDYYEGGRHTGHRHDID